MSSKVEVVFLGTCSGIPTSERNVTSIALSFDKKIWLIDCGDGTQKQMIVKGLAFQRIHRIFITHLHGDHFYGLPGLLAMLSMLKIEHEIVVFGPSGIKNLLEAIFTATQLYLGYKLTVIELTGTYLLEADPWEVICTPIVHRVPCFGYVFKERLPGKFDSSVAIQLGVPKQSLGKLSSGLPFTKPDGSIVKKEDCLSAPTTGRIITILGDTSDASAIVESALNSDLLVHETTFDASLEDRAVKSGHSTTLMAAQFAKKVNAKKLVITHFSARYDNPHGSHDKELTVDNLLEETQKACPGIQVVAAKDFLEVEVKKVN